MITPVEVWRTAQASPHTDSPRSATEKPATSRLCAAEAWPVGLAPFFRNRADMAVPPPAREYASRQADIREMAPRPVPALPAVECPSRIHSEKLAMPGPL